MPEVLPGRVRFPAFSLAGQHFLVLPRGLPCPGLHRAEPDQRLCLAFGRGLPLLGNRAHHLDHHLSNLPAPLGCPWRLPLLHHPPGHSLTAPVQAGHLLGTCLVLHDEVLCSQRSSSPHTCFPLLCSLLTPFPHPPIKYTSLPC